MRKFFIRSNNEQGLASLYVKLQKRKPAINILVNSRITVDIQVWNRANASQNAFNRFIGTTDGAAVWNKMQAINSALDNLLKQGITDKLAIDNVVADVVYADERALQRQKEEEEQRRIEEARVKAAEEEAIRKANVLLYLDNLIGRMETGEILIKGEKYKSGTIKKWKNFRGILTRFYQEHPFKWEEIDKSKVGDPFINFMVNGGYMAMSINKYIACFRAMINFAMYDRIHTNPAPKAFTKKSVDAEQKARQIYLTVGELQALYEMELSGLKEQVRDVFLVGCYTCQRFSDYNKLEASNFTTTARGTKVVRLKQKKTGANILVPILNDNLLAIVKKYEYELPTINEQVFNRYIKEILKDLSETVPSLAKLETTLLTDKERRKEERGEVVYERIHQGDKAVVVKPRYDLVSSHTARRSGITNLYLTGLFTYTQMMSISGHKEIKIFLEYIKLSSDEIADEVADIYEAAKRKNGNEDLF